MLCVAACADGDADAGATDAADSGIEDAGAVPTWHGEIAATVSNHCGACHREGGQGGFSLVQPHDWDLWGAASLNAIDEGRMPPWLPDPACRSFAGERIVSAGDRARIRAWFEAGRPLGNADDASPAPSADTDFVADITAGLDAPYTPAFDDGDDYRCLLLDVTFAADTYVTASRIAVTNPLVHHALAYVLTDTLAAEAEALDAAAPGPGYPCFGAPLPLNLTPTAADLVSSEQIADRLRRYASFPSQVATWVPGYLPDTAPDGMATRIEAGSRIVMQIHYSRVAGDVEPDSTTRLDLRITDALPDVLRTTRVMANTAIAIEAGDPESVHDRSFSYHGELPLRIRGLFAHMHLLGRQLTVQHLDAQGDRTCGIDIAHWHFDWQQMYTVLEGEEIEVRDGDALELRCVYDNSAAHQPVVAGEQLPPRDVAWGEGTLDEMCLVYLDTYAPRAEVDAARAAADPVTGCNTACAAACDPDDTACLLGCAADDLGCLGCAVDALRDCGADHCLVALASERACASACMQASVMLGSNLGDCLAARCPAAWSELVECTDAANVEGECAGVFDRCGL